MLKNGSRDEMIRDDKEASGEMVVQANEAQLQVPSRWAGEAHGYPSKYSVPVLHSLEGDQGSRGDAISIGGFTRRTPDEYQDKQQTQ